MRIWYTTGYWKEDPTKGVLAAIKTADRLGYESIWASEAYRSDTFTPRAGARRRST